MRRLPVRISTDVVAAVLLVIAASVLVATPYNAGSCRNVAAAYALPAASLKDASPPEEPATLAHARQAVAGAEADSAALQSEQAAADSARAAASKARQAADAAQTDLYMNPVSTDPASVDVAQSDVDYRQSMVDSAASWLQTVQQGAADTSPWGSVYTQQDVQQAQQDLDDARAQLATAQDALTQARTDEAAKEAAAASAQQSADQLGKDADAAEKAADDAESRLAKDTSDVEDRLSAARSLLSELESEHRAAVADWSHQRRLDRDQVVALNNVRASCRESGGWRAGVAVLDVLLIVGLGVRRWWPSLWRMRMKLPRVRLPRLRR